MSDMLKAMRASFAMTKQRCYNQKCRDYPYYGGRGIKVCDRWLESFDNFVEDMGIRPEGLTLERLDVNGDYSKDNCYWATRAEQTNNRRLTVTITYNGETKSISEWSRETGIPYDTLKARKQRLGYTDAECIEKPVVPGQGLPNKVYKLRSYDAKKGFDAPRSKLNEKLVADIGKLLATGKTKSALAREFKLSHPTIVKAGKLYANTLKNDELQVP